MINHAFIDFQNTFRVTSVIYILLPIFHKTGLISRLVLPVFHNVCALESNASHESLSVKPKRLPEKPGSDILLHGTILHTVSYTAPLPSIRSLSEAHNCSTMDSASVAVHAELLSWYSFLTKYSGYLGGVAHAVKVHTVYAVYLQRHLHQHKAFIKTARRGILYLEVEDRRNNPSLSVENFKAIYQKTKHF